MAEGQYIRVYHLFRDEYPAVWKSDAQLALFVRLLMVADKWWPQWAPVPRRNGGYQSLVACGLVLENEGATGYTILGLDTGRSKRSEHGRRAASIRHAGSEHAQTMPSRAEQFIPKQSSGNGQSPTTFMGYRPRATPTPERLPGEAVVPRHDGTHPDCAICDASKVALSIEEQHAESMTDAARKTAERAKQ